MAKTKFEKSQLAHKNLAYYWNDRGGAQASAKENYHKDVLTAQSFRGKRLSRAEKRKIFARNCKKYNYHR